MVLYDIAVAYATINQKATHQDIASVNHWTIYTRKNTEVFSPQIYHQQEIQQQLIQNILTYAQNDPELTARLLTLLQQSKLDPSESVSPVATDARTILLG